MVSRFFFKSQNSANEPWYSYYSQWVNIQPAWEGNWREFSANPSDAPGYQDAQFDPMKIVALGIKMVMNTESNATVNGILYLDNVQLETNPPIRLDFEKLEIETDLDELVCNTDTLRVFVFADGRAAPEFTATGAIANPGFDENFFEDFDALLQTAHQHNFKIIPTLLDFGWCNQAEFNNSVQLGGHSDVICDPTKRQTFLDFVLTPFIQRYATGSEILCVDIMNEPEWVIQEVAPGANVDPVTLQQMQDFVQACTNIIHASSQHLVTVGSARRKWLHHWQGLGLDMYQFHWYENFLGDETFPWLPYSDLGLDKPCFVGEVPMASTSRTFQEYLDAALNGGYSGLLGWSYRAKDAYSNYQSAKLYMEGRCTYLPTVKR